MDIVKFVCRQFPPRSGFLSHPTMSCQCVHFFSPLITGTAFILTDLKTANDTPFSCAPLLFFPKELPAESLDKAGSGGKEKEKKLVVLETL